MVARRPYRSIGSYPVYVRKVSLGPLWSQSGGSCRPPPLHIPPDCVIAPGDVADAGDHKGLHTIPRMASSTHPSHPRPYGSLGLLPVPLTSSLRWRQWGTARVVRTCYSVLNVAKASTSRGRQSGSRLQSLHLGCRDGSGVRRVCLPTRGGGSSPRSSRVKAS